MKFNYNKTYYKVTNKTENHNGLQYKTGLIEDILPFNSNPDITSVRGRIYFTDLEHLPLFFGYGCWVRPLTIPLDAQIVMENDKVGANKIIMQERITVEEYFKTLFDPEKFDWYCSGYLAQYCSEHFQLWFDPEKFNWNHSKYLAQYCSEHFHAWFDPEKFNWGYSRYLALYCSEYFQSWFDPEKFDWYYSDCLARCCSEYFSLWFDPEKFDWSYSGYLVQYCTEHKHKKIKEKNYAKTN